MRKDTVCVWKSKKGQKQEKQPEEVDRLDEQGPSEDRKQVKKPQDKCLDKY